MRTGLPATRGPLLPSWLLPLVAFLSYAVVIGTGPPASSSIDDLDAMWANTSPIAHDRCLYFIVKAWPDQVLRGRISPHDCVVSAIREYRRGDHEHAMGWLQAGLCPNREAQQRLVQQAPAVFDHLLTSYGRHVP